jgi:hypothetical protein
MVNYIKTKYVLYKRKKIRIFNPIKYLIYIINIYIIYIYIYINI